MVILPPDPAGTRELGHHLNSDTSCVVVQTPDVFGHLHDLRPLAARAHANGSLLIAVITEVISLGCLQPPGASGADIVVSGGPIAWQPVVLRGALRRADGEPAAVSSATCRAGSSV